MKLKEEMLKHVATWEKFTNRVCFFLKIWNKLVSIISKAWKAKIIIRFTDMRYALLKENFLHKAKIEKI